MARPGADEPALEPGLRKSIKWRSRLVALAVVSALAVGCTSRTASPGILESPVTIGVTIDKPGMTSLDSGSAEFSGFDVDFYRWLANDQKFEIIESPVAVEDREDVLRDGTVDLVIGSYTITDLRDELVDFAGPYLQTRQGVMVRADFPRTITNPSQLAGLTGCAQNESTSANELKNIPNVVVRTETGLSDCVAALREQDVHFVSTDNLLLHGYTQEYPDLRIEPDVTFGPPQRYGVGIPPESGTKDCEFITSLIRDFLASGAWGNAFRSSFGEDLNSKREEFKPRLPLRGCVPDPDEPS